MDFGFWIKHVVSICVQTKKYELKELFDSYKYRNDGDVVMVNGSRSKVIEKGTIKMKIYDRII